MRELVEIIFFVMRISSLSLSCLTSALRFSSPSSRRKSAYRTYREYGISLSPGPSLNERSSVLSHGTTCTWPWNDGLRAGRKREEKGRGEEGGGREEAVKRGGRDRSHDDHVNHQKEQKHEKGLLLQVVICRRQYADPGISHNARYFRQYEKILKNAKICQLKSGGGR